MSAARSAFVVVVSGLPAAGKSTLASRLAADLGVRMVSRDELREQVLEHMPAGSSLDAVARATTALVLEVLAAALEGGGAVLDGNFNRPEHADGLAELIASRGARAVEVCLWADGDTLRRRFAERATPPLTDDLRPYFESVLSRRRQPVLGDGHLVAEFDTTSFETLDSVYEDLLARVRADVA